MTEAEWLACSNPAAMLNALCPDHPTLPQPSDRKLRLFACAVVRLFDRHFTAAMLRVVEVAERMADGLAVDEDFYAASREEHGNEIRPENIQLWVLVYKCAANLSWSGSFLAHGSVEQAVYLASGLAGTIAALLHDVVGNPFRSFAVPIYGGDLWHKWMAWNGGLVPRFARTIYDERRFDQAAILADALEDAGCREEVILRHLRGWEPCRLCSCDELKSSACPECHCIGWTKPWCAACKGTGRKIEEVVVPDPPGTFSSFRPRTEKQERGCLDCGGTGNVHAVHVRGCWALDCLSGRE